MSRILKVTSANNPPFNVSRNHIRIDIPQSAGTVDLANSALLLKCKVNTTETAGNVGIHSVRFANGIQGTQAYPVNALLKNVKLVNQKQGTIEEIQHWNVLSVNMLDKTNSSADKISQAVLGNYNDNNLVNETAFRTLGLTASVEREPVLKIPLKSMFGMCSESAYNTAKNGVLSVQVETEDIEEILGENITYKAGATLACDNVTAGGNPITEIESTATTFTADNKLTLWAGAKVKISYTAGGAPVETEHIVKEVSRNVGNKMVIEVEGAGLGSVDITGVSLIQVEASKIDYEISDASLKVVTSQEKDGGKVVFRTWSLEAVNKLPTLNFQRDFDLENNCMNVFLMTPTDSLMSANDNVVDYRYRIDGRDVVSESVVVDSQLYQDRLMMTLLNSGSMARNLRSNGKMYANPVKNVKEKQVLHLSMRHNPVSASPVSYLFKQLEREF